MDDFIAALELTRRALVAGPDADLPHVVELRRTLRAPGGDVWDACTDPQRLARWFLPVDGDLRPGGRYQSQGNAGGTITTCEPPHRLELTWEFGEMPPSRVTLRLDPLADDVTKLVLQHAVPDDDHWAQYGPGATGVGWDGALVGLTAHLAGHDLPHGAEFLVDPQYLDFLRRSALAWGAAHEAAGADAETAAQAAVRTSEFYAPQGQPAG